MQGLVRRPLRSETIPRQQAADCQVEGAVSRIRRFDPEATLDTAVDTFWEGGFEATGMQQLCAAMGLFPGSVYSAYGGKRTLFLRVLDRYMATISRDAVERLGRSGSGLQAIREYFAHLIEGIIEGKRRWGCLITNTIIELAQRDPDIALKVKLHLARIETAFAGAIARARAAGEISEDSALDAAGFLVCLVQGLNVLARTQPDRQHLNAIVAIGLAGLR